MRTFLFLVGLLLTVSQGMLFAHMRYGDPLPSFYVENKDNVSVLKDYLSLKEKPVLGLHYYYYRSGAAQEIVVNVMKHSDEKARIEGAWMIAHCNGAALQPAIRQEIVEILKSMAQSLNPQARRAAAAAIGSNRFTEVMPALIRLINDDQATVRLEAVAGLTAANEQSCRAEIEKLSKTETNKQVREHADLYLKRVH